MTTTTRRQTVPTCVRVPADTPACPDCGGVVFRFEDEDGEQLVCIDCTAFVPTYATDD